MEDTAAAPLRGPAMERRLRRRRQEARLRLRLLADSVILAGHHASQPPALVAADASTPWLGWKREASELRALVDALRAQVDSLVAGPPGGGAPGPPGGGAPGLPCGGAPGGGDAHGPLGGGTPGLPGGAAPSGLLSGDRPGYSQSAAIEPLFTAAQAALEAMTDLSHANKLLVYASYKQATAGKATGTRPSMFDVGVMPWDQSKFDAWAKLGDMDADTAKGEYCKLADRLAPGWRPAIHLDGALSAEAAVALLGSPSLTR